MTNTNENVVWITGASSGIGKAMAFEWDIKWCFLLDVKNY